MKTAMCRECHFVGRQQPLISTFAFRKFEFWCAFCGLKTGMFGNGIVASEPLPEYQETHDAYKDAAKIFLLAHAVTSCFSFRFHGVDTKPSELPEAVLRAASKWRTDGWKYGVELEDLKPCGLPDWRETT